MTTGQSHEHASNFDFDVGVIGGGPAGAATAAYLARAGVRCIVFEKQNFPRFHVGESLVPAANRVLRDLDLLEKMEAAGFPHKYGAAWTSSQGHSANMDFAGIAEEVRGAIEFKERPLHGAEQDYTYHVDRAKFDDILLEQARSLGAEVQQTTGVKRVEFPEPNNGSENENEAVRIVTSDGNTETVTRVRVVVDASGRKTLLGRQLGLRVNDPYFDQFALHTWFEDYDRGDTNERNFALIHFIPRTATWVWQIPISETITSFGIVTQKENFVADREEWADFFWDGLKTRPEVYEKLRAAKQIRPFTAEGDYSYSMTRMSGRGYVLVGDAARFVDPVFSSGISIALNGARMAADAILTAFRDKPNGGVLEEADFHGYETTQKRGMRNWYEFISLYYRLNILFTYFVQDVRYRFDLLTLLQGEVYEEDRPPVLEEMRRVVEVVEKNPDHAWHKLLSSLRTNAPWSRENEAVPS